MANGFEKVVDPLWMTAVYTAAAGVSAFEDMDRQFMQTLPQPARQVYGFGREAFARLGQRLAEPVLRAQYAMDETFRLASDPQAYADYLLRTHEQQTQDQETVFDFSIGNAVMRRVGQRRLSRRAVSLLCTEQETGFPDEDNMMTLKRIARALIDMPDFKIEHMGLPEEDAALLASLLDEVAGRG